MVYGQVSNLSLEGNVSGGIITPFKGNVSDAIVNDTTGFEQNASAGAKASSSASYKQSYLGERADDKRPFTVHSEKHLYKPSEEVRIEGSIWSSLINEIGGDIASVNLDVTDNKGNVVIAEKAVEVENNDEFSTSFTLPQNAEQGSYSIKAVIKVEASVLDTLGADVKSKLETSARFEVVSPVAFAVKAEGKDFEVKIASNSTSVRELVFSQPEKKVSFKVEGDTGTKGVAQVTLPKELLSGKLVVSIDGRAVAEDSNDVIVTSDTSTEMTLEINYPHSERTIEITGTTVIPEFPVSVIVMAAAIGAVVAFLAITRRTLGFIHRI
jgi:hypothetical protein